MKTAAQAAQAWIDSAPRAATNYQAGVNGYTGDWAGATIAAAPQWQAGLTQAFANNSWQNGISSVGTAGWKSKTTAKVANYSTGFTAGAAEQSQAIGKIMTALSGIVPALPPRGTYTQNKARANALMDALHALKGQLGATG